MGEASGYVPYTVYMATDKFMEEHPDVVQKFTNAIYKGQLWVKNHSSEEIAKTILPQFPETDLETLTKIIDRYKQQDSWKDNPIFEEESFQLIQEIMKEGGELSSLVPYKDMIITDFAQKAMEQVK